MSEAERLIAESDARIRRQARPIYMGIWLIGFAFLLLLAACYWEGSHR